MSKRYVNRVALINPPVPNNRNWVREGRCQQLDIWGAPFPPFTLAMVSRRLVDLDCETIIIDAGPEGKTKEQVFEQLKNFSPDYIAMTISTPTVDTDLGWFLKDLKPLFPDTVIAGIGIHVSTLSRETLDQYSELNCVVIGEPELAIGELFSQEKSQINYQPVLGIVYRGQDGKIIANEKREFTEDLDGLGIPDWQKINFKNYIMPIKGEPFSLVHFARGCPHRCSYCTAHTFNGRGFRKRSVESLMKELEFNLSLGVRDFLFWTELMTADAKYLNSVLDEIIKRGLHTKIRWVCNSRVDTVTPEILRKMKQAGCWQIAFGFDFGTDKLLKQTQKGGRASVEQGKLAAKMAADAGLTVDGHFMLGYPGENEEDMQQTIKFALSTPLTFSHFYSVVPYPGSQLYNDWLEMKKQQGSATDVPKWNEFDQRTALVNAPGLQNDTIMQYKKTAYRKFYFRPQVAMRIFKIPKSVDEFVNLCMASLHTLRALVFW